MTDRGEQPLLGIASVRNILASGALSVTAISLMLAVLFKQAFDITDDPLTIGIVGLLQFIPAVLLVFVSGYLADRYDRRSLVAWTTVGRVACVIGFFIYSRSVGDVSGGSDAAVWPLYVITFVFGSFDAVGIPARHAITPLVVRRELLPRLVAARASTMVFSTIVGPIAAGFLYTVGADVAYVVAAILFVASIPPLLRTTYAVEPTRLNERPSLGLVLDGLRFIRRSPIILGAISLDMFAVLFGGAIALIPVIAEERLGVGDVAYGFLRAAPGVGAGLMGLWLARRPVSRRVGATLLWVVAIFGFFHITLGLTTSYAVAFVSLMCAAAADMVSMTIRSTLVPLATPPEQLGRVSAVESVFIGASNELGAFESGVAARYLGVPWAVAGGGVITILVAGGIATALPTLRNIDTYDDVRAPGDVPTPTTPTSP